MVELYRRPGSDNWYFDVTLDGKRLRRSTRTSIKRAAQKIADKEFLRLIDGKADTLPELTLRQALFDHYLPSRKGLASHPELERLCGLLVGDHPGVEGLDGDLPFHQLTNTMIRAYRGRRIGSGRAERTVNLEMRVLSGAYRLLADEYRIAPGLRFPVVVPKPRARFLTAKEERALLRELDPLAPLKARGGGYRIPPADSDLYRHRQDNHDLVVLMLDTGCRVGEIVGLPWAMVDVQAFAWLHIYRGKVDNEARFATTSRLREVLQRRWMERTDDPWVFSHSRAKGRAQRSTAAIRRAMNKIGINAPANVARFGRRDVRSLRDTFATKLRQQGMSLDRLQELLGHASPQMTAKYAHLSVSDASLEAVAMLDRPTSTAHFSRSP